MAQVACMIRSFLNSQEAESKLAVMEQDAVTEKLEEHAVRIAAYREEVKQTGTLELVQRIKIEVSTIEEVRAIGERRDFVRFCCGGHPDIYSLITVRKAAGRSDWYV